MYDQHEADTQSIRELLAINEQLSEEIAALEEALAQAETDLAIERSRRGETGRLEATRNRMRTELEALRREILRRSGV